MRQRKPDLMNSVFIEYQECHAGCKPHLFLKALFDYQSAENADEIKQNWQKGLEFGKVVRKQRYGPLCLGGNHMNRTKGSP